MRNGSKYTCLISDKSESDVIYRPYIAYYYISTGGASTHTHTISVNLSKEILITFDRPLNALINHSVRVHHGRNAQKVIIILISNEIDRCHPVNVACYVVFC